MPCGPQALAVNCIVSTALPHDPAVPVKHSLLQGRLAKNPTQEASALPLSYIPPKQKCSDQAGDYVSGVQGKDQISFWAKLILYYKKSKMHGNKYNESS